MDVSVPVDKRVKIEESEKNKQIYEPCRRSKKKKKLWNVEVTVIPIELLRVELSPKVGGKFGRSGDQKKYQVYPDVSMVEIDQNTQMNPGNLKGLAVT